MSNYDHYLKDRQRYIEEAKSSLFLDAVFLMVFYNKNVKLLGPQPKPDDIHPSDIFAQYDENEFQLALKKSLALLNNSSYVGEAFFKYPGAATYESAVDRLEKEHPGFSRRSYGLVSNSSITAAR